MADYTLHPMNNTGGSWKVLWGFGFSVCTLSSDHIAYIECMINMCLWVHVKNRKPREK